MKNTNCQNGEQAALKKERSPTVHWNVVTNSSSAWKFLKTIVLLWKICSCILSNITDSYTLIFLPCIYIHWGLGLLFVSLFEPTIDPDGWDLFYIGSSTVRNSLQKGKANWLNTSVQLSTLLALGCLMWQILLTWHWSRLNGEVFAKTGWGISLSVSWKHTPCLQRRDFSWTWLILLGFSSPQCLQYLTLTYCTPKWINEYLLWMVVRYIITSTSNSWCEVQKARYVLMHDVKYITVNVHLHLLTKSLISSVDLGANVTTFMSTPSKFSAAAQTFVWTDAGDFISHTGGGQLSFGLMARWRPESDPDESNLKGPHFSPLIILVFFKVIFSPCF